MTTISPEAEKKLRRNFHTLNRFMLLMGRLGMARVINIWSAVGERVMVMQHAGRVKPKLPAHPFHAAATRHRPGRPALGVFRADWLTAGNCVVQASLQ